MKDTDVIQIFFSLISEEYDYDKPYYTDFLHRTVTQRLGQAFVNTLPIEYQRKLRASGWDPFYSNEWASVYNAIDELTRK